MSNAQENVSLTWDSLKATGWALLRRDLCAVLCGDGKPCSRQVEVWRGKQGQILKVNITGRKAHEPTCMIHVFPVKTDATV